MIGTGFPKISPLCNLDPIAERLCICGVHTQNLTKGWEKTTNVIVLDTLSHLLGDADEFKVTSESAHELTTRHGFGSKTEEGDKVSDAKSGIREHRSEFSTWSVDNKTKTRLRIEKHKPIFRGTLHAKALLWPCTSDLPKRHFPVTNCSFKC